MYIRWLLLWCRESTLRTSFPRAVITATITADTPASNSCSCARFEFVDVCCYYMHCLTYFSLCINFHLVGVFWVNLNCSRVLILHLFCCCVPCRWHLADARMSISKSLWLELLMDMTVSELSPPAILIHSTTWLCPQVSSPVFRCCLLTTVLLVAVMTFHVRRSRGKMYIGHACLCVCPLPHAHTTARTRM